MTTDVKTDISPRRFTVAKDPYKQPANSYDISFIHDRRYLSSPNFAALQEVDIPKMTLDNINLAQGELKGITPIKISVSIVAAEKVGQLIDGIGGFADVKQIQMFINPSFQDENFTIANNFTRHWPGLVRNLTARAVREQNLGKQDRFLLQMLISEGIAMYYQENSGDRIASPFKNALTPDQISKEWEKAKPILEKELTEQEKLSWKYGIGNRHPKNTISALGYAIVKKFMENNPDTQMKDLVRMRSQKIFDGSEFAEQTQKL